MHTISRKFIRCTLCFIIMLPIILLIGCRSGDPVGLRDVVEGNNNLIAEEFEDVVTETIGAGGGTIRVDTPNDPMDGFEISVPSNSYTGSRTFEVSRAEIKNHNLGQYFNPISPLIKISNGGGYADEVMEVKVPVKVPEGYFAMGFFYDEESGTLEGLPLLALDSTSVTVGTRHFSTSDLSGDMQKALFKSNALPSFSDLVISAIDLAVLQGQDVISTGYELKKDNWEFGNPGTYIAAPGICEGMSLSSMWYYLERQQKGQDPLYSLFDQVDPIKQDNPRGIRFASMVHIDYKGYRGMIDRFFNDMRKKPDYDYLSWNALALTMLLQHAPQLVVVLSPSGGHAIVAYKMSLAKGTLEVADPNYPDQLRTIEYINKHFKPYSSKESVTDLEDAFTGIAYCAKTAAVDWSKIGERWKEFENSTIGNDNFPKYTIWVLNGGVGSELADKFTTDLDTLVVEVRCPTAERYWNINSLKIIGHEVFDDQGNLLSTTTGGFDESLYFSGFNTRNSEPWRTATKLKPGLNKLGFTIFGWRNGDINPNNNQNYAEWIDFRWVEVTCQKLEIKSGETNGAPILTAGEPYKALKFLACSNGSAPRQAKYVWNFGDGTPEAIAYDDSTMQHTFYAEGNYTVTAALFDNAANALVFTAKVDVKIGTDKLDLLHKCKGVRVDFRGLGNFQWDDGSASQQDINDTFLNLEGMQNIYENAPAISWSGTSFTLEFSRAYASPYLPDEVYDCKLTISGSVSSDGMSITNLTATEDRILQKDRRDLSHTKIEIKGIPLTAQNPPSDELAFIFNAEGDQVQQFISGYEHVFTMVQESGTIVKTQTFMSFDWSTHGERWVTVSFDENKEY